MKAKLFSASFLGLLLAAVPAHAEAPRVVASIAPIHSLVASVMEGVGEPELLIPAAVSGHDYALKPSDIRKIADADLVVWLGAALETYLVKPLATEGTMQLELLEAKGVDPHPFAVEGGKAEDDQSAAADGHEGGHGHDRLGLDPHVWLDPVRAEAIVTAVAKKLSEIDPENADLYETNADLAIAELQALNSEIGTQLAPVSAKPFITFHDGYSYFVERYGLNQVGQLTVNPEQRPGAASLSALRATIANEGVACAFAEPQFDQRAIRSLAGDADIAIGTLDPLGAGLEPGPLLYGELLRENTKAVVSCLSSSS